MSWFYWALIASLFWALGPIFAKLGLVKSDPFTALLARSLGVVTFLLLGALVTGKLGRLATMDARTWTLLVAEGLVASILAQFAYYSALSQASVAQVTPVAACYPLLAMLFAALLLGNAVTPTRALGGLFIALGIYLVQR